jgi:hypothetical protein
MRGTISLGAASLLAACGQGKGTMVDAELQATALVALASDANAPPPSAAVVCFGLTRPGTLGVRAPDPEAWRRIRQAFPNARLDTDCAPPDTADAIWPSVLLDSVTAKSPTERVAWGAQVAEHANVWRCSVRRERGAWTAGPCEHVGRAPQDQPDGS